jgi:hypothetical protein
MRKEYGRKNGMKQRKGRNGDRWKYEKSFIVEFQPAFNSSVIHKETCILEKYYPPHSRGHFCLSCWDCRILPAAHTPWNKSYQWDFRFSWSQYEGDTPGILCDNPDNGGSKHLWNISQHL